MVQTLMTSLVTQRGYLAAEAGGKRVLMWLCEDTENDILRRQQAINAHLGLGLDSIEQLQENLYVVPRRGLDNTLLTLDHGVPTLTTAFYEMEEQVSDVAADVLVLDNIAQVFGGNGIDSHHVTKFVNALAALRLELPFAPILLGHIAKSQGSEFSGSMAWENACRMRWYMGPTLPDQKPDAADAEAGDDVVYLAKRKANYAAKDWRRFNFKDGVFVPEVSEQPGGRFDQAYRDEAAEGILLLAMRKLSELKLDVSVGSTSPNYLPKQVVKRKLSGGHSLKELEAAMNRLLLAGRIENRDVGMYGNRTTRKGLVIVDSGSAQASCSSSAQASFKPAHIHTPPIEGGGVFEHEHEPERAREVKEFFGKEWQGFSTTRR
jgi:hypothetical protein